jgi:hypothetical protein
MNLTHVMVDNESRNEKKEFARISILCVKALMERSESKQKRKWKKERVLWVVIQLKGRS